MVSNIAELKKQIKKARKQLVASARLWLESELYDIDDVGINVWITALDADNREQMQEKIREHGLPLFRFDEIVDQQLDSTTRILSHSERLDETITLVKSNYSPAMVKDSELYPKLSYLFTLMDQLHLLENLLYPIPPINLKPLKLAGKMAKGIVKELSLAEPGIETLKYYQKRFTTAYQQFENGQQNNLESVHIFEGQLKAKKLQFSFTLKHIATTLSRAYDSVQDTRYWFIRAFSAYLPWHALLDGVASTIFGQDGVLHPNHLQLDIPQQKFIAMTTLFANELQQPLTLVRKEQLLLDENIKEHFKMINFHLDSMKNNLETFKVLAISPDTALSYIMPTQIIGFHQLFQNLGAVYGNTNPQPKIPELKEFEEPCEYKI